MLRVTLIPSFLMTRFDQGASLLVNACLLQPENDWQQGTLGILSNQEVSISDSSSFHCSSLKHFVFTYHACMNLKVIFQKTPVHVF